MDDSIRKVSSTNGMQRTVVCSERGDVTDRKYAIYVLTTILESCQSFHTFKADKI